MSEPQADSKPRLLRTKLLVPRPHPELVARPRLITRLNEGRHRKLTSILLIPAITTIFHVLIVATIIAATGGPLFGGALPTRWGAFALVTLLTAFCCAGLGALIGVVAEGSRGTVLLSQLIFLPSMLLGGLMMPLEILPASVQPISSLLPATHSMQAFLGLAYGQETLIDPLVAVIVLLSSGLLAFGLAIYLFNWDSRNRARRGHPLMALLALVPYVIAAVALI